MKWLHALTLISVLCAGSFGLSAAEPVKPSFPAVALDPAGHLLPRDLAAETVIAKKIAAFAAERGVHLELRLQAKSPSDEEDKIPGAYMQAWSKRLGLDRTGVLLAYFCDEDDWRAWVSDDLTATFASRPGTAKELTDSGAMHEAKEALLKAAMSAGDTKVGLAGGVKIPAADFAAARVRAQAEALVDGLVAKFPAPAKAH